MSVTRKKINTRVRATRPDKRISRQAKARPKTRAASPTKRRQLKDALAKLQKQLGPVPAFLKRIDEAASKNGRRYLSLRDINREIKAVRKEKPLDQK